MSSSLSGDRRLIVLRHAHRDTSLRAHDNGLTDKGKKQSDRIAEFFVSRFESSIEQDPIVLLSSPKIRCQQTLEPLAKALQTKIRIDDALNEQDTRHESNDSFCRRISNYWERWTSHDPVPITIVCSHGDWIPVFYEMVLGSRLDLKKGAWSELVYSPALGPRLEWLVQKFKFLDL